MARLVFRMFLTVFVLLVLAACGNTATQEPAEDETTPSALVETEPTDTAEDEAEAMAEPTAEEADESMDDETMADESDESMDEHSDGALDDEAMDESDEAMVEPTAEVTDEAEQMTEPTAAADEAGTEAETIDEATTEDAAEVAEEPAEEVAEEPAEEVAEEPVEEPAAAVADRPAWQQLALTDARTGETFTLADFADKIVYVEPMATWCSNCRQQLGNVSQARAQLDSEQYAFIALSVETNISNADLAAYADGAGFDWTFAVMTPEVLQALTDVFGRTITNPPATPSFIIRTDGTTTDLMTGITAPDVIIEELNAIQES